MERLCNNLISGILSGIILPVIIFMMLYQTKFSNLEFIEFPKHMLMGNLLPLIISWCVLPNLLLFFVFSWTNWLKSAKGVLISTTALTLLLFSLKIIFH
jgi:hypothetical protein